MSMVILRDGVISLRLAYTPGAEVSLVSFTPDGIEVDDMGRGRSSIRQLTSSVPHAENFAKFLLGPRFSTQICHTPFVR
ncbi:MAG TPA: hypothetical protein VFP42_08820, partial [Acidimicrobiia bacterium]|nr:hypothetical protein [Acidimicrobiia bacterium]